MKLIIIIFLQLNLSFSNLARFLSPSAQKLVIDQPKINSIDPEINHKDNLQSKISLNQNSPERSLSNLNEREIKTNPNEQEIKTNPNEQEIKTNPNEQEMKTNPNEQEMKTNPNEQEMKTNPNEPNKSSPNLNNLEKNLEEENPVEPISQDNSNYPNQRETGKKGEKTDSSNYYFNCLYLLICINLLY